MPPPLPTHHRGMTANPVKPSRYRPGKAVPEDPSSEEEDEEDEEDEEAQKEQERRQRAEAQRRRQQAPKASSFPAAAAQSAQAARPESDEDEEGFVTDEEEDQPAQPAQVPPTKVTTQAQPETTKAAPPRPAAVPVTKASEDDEEEDEEEESSEEESSSEDEAPRRMLIRPTFIKKDKRGAQPGKGPADQAQGGSGAVDSAADEEKRRAQRQEKADMLVRDQLEKEAIARSAGNRAWDDDELVEADEEAAIDDRDDLDPEAEHAAWKLRELKRVKRSREAIEEAEKEREEVERRRNLTAEERDREDREFLAKQKEERDATRGQTGFMQRYFHKGAFFRDDLEREGLDQRNAMSHRFVDDVSRETLPQYMQVRDMTKLGKKGRTRYRDLKSEDTGRFGEGYQNRRRDGPPVGITDERFMPDRGDDRGQGPQGPTGANASVVRSRRRSRSRSRSPRRDRRDDDRYDRSRSRERRKRSPSPYGDSDKRRRVEGTS